VRTTKKIAEINLDLCNGCTTCVKVCPVVAIKMEKTTEGKIKQKAKIDPKICTACTICVARCPQEAIKMSDRSEPISVGVKVEKVTPEIEAICTAAHMFPDQIICYCNRVDAKEIAQAIIEGAKTPDEISRRTGARVGCGVLCHTGIIRLLKGAGIALGKAPGYQWYDIKTIWDVPKEFSKKYPEFYVEEDKKAIANIFPGGEK